MPIGIFVNASAIVLGGILGTLIGKKMSPQFISQMNLVVGMCSFGMGMSSIALMKNMPAVVLAVIVGTAVGLICSVGHWITRGAELLQRPITRIFGQKLPSDITQEEFFSLLVTAMVLFCASGTGIYGCLDVGMTGDNTILLAKSVLDLFAAMVFACNLGLVTSIVAVPQLVIFMLLFFAAKVIVPLTTPDMIGDFKACGGFLMIATGFRITKIKDFPIADMLPAMVLVLPFSGFWINVILPLLS